MAAPRRDLLPLGSGGDDLVARFSRELADVATGDEVRHAERLPSNLYIVYFTTYTKRPAHRNRGAPR